MEMILMSEKTENSFGKLCKIILFPAFIYGLVLPFMWGNDPLSPTGTLSLLCEDRKIYFWIWGILTAGSIILNTQYIFKRYEYKNTFLNICCVLGFISVCVVALTLGHSTASWNPKRVAHWISTGMYIAFTVALLLLFFLLNVKKHKGFWVLFVIVALILGVFLFIFAVIGKCALMESVPVALIEVFLFIYNFTPLLNKFS